MTKKTTPLILAILDGFGFCARKSHNAIASANTPFIDKLWNEYPHALLQASGSAVGLPEGQIGSSEVGHSTIGTGTVLDQDLVRLNKAINSGELITNPAISSLAEQVINNNSVLHLIGLVSPGGVHSHQEHLHQLIKTFKDLGVIKIVIHAFTDGRDVHPQSSHTYLAELEKFLASEGVGVIASISGRYWGMDRDNNFDRIKRAEDAIFHCQGNVCEFKKPSEIIKQLHADGKGDEFFEPHIFTDSEGRTVGVEKNDGLFFFNFRPDRMRQLVGNVIKRAAGDNLSVASLMEYDSSFGISVAFPKLSIQTTLTQEVAKAGLSQVHIAETDKFAHITYFFNGGRKVLLDKEKNILIESRKDVFTHDLEPEMQAKGITDAAIKAIDDGEDVIYINYANADIVGHTGNFEATVRAIETLDAELARLFTKVESCGGVMVITADHGNAEVNQHENGDKHSAHTSNPVPIFITNKTIKIRDGNLADVAPTILELLNISKPQAMQGSSLIE